MAFTSMTYGYASEEEKAYYDEKKSKRVRYLFTFSLAFVDSRGNIRSITSPISYVSISHLD